MSTFCFVLGTRPEIIKLAPLLRRAAASGIPFELIHTNQHYDHALDGVFFEELSLPKPTRHLHAAAPGHGEMIGKILTGLEEAWSERRPDVVIVQGDTNSVFGAAFCASRFGIPVAHVEAGLRSDDLSMPEEVNRILTDRLSSRLYVPTDRQVERLRSEGIDQGKILVVGNTIADAVAEHRELAAQTPLPAALQDVTRDRFALITLHRPALVDDADRLHGTVTVLAQALEAHGLRPIFLIHPRTRKHLDPSRIPASVLLHEPVGYLPMLRLLAGASLIATDSGGLQEEAALLHVPCITLRENTERPETVEAGGNRVTGFEERAIRDAVEHFLSAPVSWKRLYTVDSPADAIFNDLRSHYAPAHHIG